MKNSFGESLKLARDRAGLTQKEVAELTNLSQSQLSRYESDETSPTADIIKDFALLYNVSTDFLFGLQKNFLGDEPRKGIIAMETDVQLCVKQFTKLSTENRARTLGYMDGLVVKDKIHVSKNNLSNKKSE